MTEGRVPLNAFESKRVSGFEGAEPDMPVSKLVSLVPQLTDVVEGDMLVQYVVKDSALIFHIYHVARKHLRDEAVEMASRHVSDPRYLNQLNTLLVQKLQEIPWPVGMEAKLKLEFFDFYREPNVDVQFVPEMDSWSVMMPKPVLPTATTPDAIRRLITKVSHACFGAKQ